MPDGAAGKGPAGSVGSAWAPASAMLMIVAGIVLAGAGFVVDPLGELSDSVLWFVSQGLIYAGGHIWCGGECECASWRCAEGVIVKMYCICVR